ncbi:MAG: hypothetical protein KGS61_14735, partial [Verrucomicrobia bacterium]|nr:hypothetical protein [Verrucomicrobiota bacterium]
MSVPASPSLRQALSPSDTPSSPERRALLAEIDASCKWPVLLFFACGLAWLMLGTLFALIAS